MVNSRSIAKGVAPRPYNKRTGGDVVRDVHKKKKTAQATARPSAEQQTRRPNAITSMQTRAERDSRGGDDEYPSMVVVLRGIPTSTIKNDWRPLPPVAIDQVGQLLGRLQADTVYGMKLYDKDEDHRAEKRQQADSILSLISRKIQGKITKGMRFPPETRPKREDDFNFERLVDSNRQLQANLTPLLHSVELLKNQIRREEALLAEERAELEALENNSRTEKRRQDADLKKSNILLQGDDQDTMSFTRNIAVSDEMPSPELHIDFRQDPELEAITGELDKHLRSISTNQAPLVGLQEAMSSGRASLQDVLHKYLPRDRYDQVVLG